MGRSLHLATALFPALLLAASPAGAAEFVRHDLSVTIDPERNRLSAMDVVTVPEAVLAEHGRRVAFTLHAGLSPHSMTPDVVLVPGGRSTGLLEPFWLTFPEGIDSVTLEYGGVILHELEQVGEEYARGQKTTVGTIGPEGVFLAGSSGWYPAFDLGLITFSLRVAVVGGWLSVSQGERARHRVSDSRTFSSWESPEPQDEIYLVAGKYTEYAGDAGEARAMVLLREPDAALAADYLEATAQYLSLYEGLIGPYPYAKFATVENFWETGYGMPSFTVLGPRVIRFPFILHSSFPHEILHNWWGNSVFIDYAGGNWGEGLTAYLADHLVKEQRGDGAEHRQTTLQKYRDYVLAGRDLPLTEFRSRHGSVTEAVGYGKSLMLFHMLRRSLGDDTFREGLRRFFADNLWKTAGFDDVRSAFEAVSGRDLAGFFEQWVTRTGAPELAVAGAEPRQKDGAWELSLVLEQRQAEEPFVVAVPVAVTLEGRPEALVTTLEMTGRRVERVIPLPARPLRVDVDPEFDVFRRLHRKEIPPALSQAFGAREAVIILPFGASDEMLDAYGDLADALSRTGPGQVTTDLDSEIEKVPADASVWLLGWENRFLPAVTAGLAPYGAELGTGTFRFARADLPRAGHTAVAALPHPGDPDLAMLWIALDDPAAVPGLGRKLPHYHKYSYLAFEGSEPANVATGRWPPTGSPLSVILAGSEGEPPPQPGTLPARTALASLPSVFSSTRMTETVRKLADPALEGRGFGSPGLEQAAALVAAGFAEAGIAPAGDEPGSYFRKFVARGDDPEREASLCNVVGVIPGTDDSLRGESVVVGAHYDGQGTGWPGTLAVNRGTVHPGADDNASGVAVLLELARTMADSRPPRSIVFAAFAGEEAGRAGSRNYVAAGGALPAPNAVGMVNIDTVGRLGKGKLLVLGGSSAREWVHLFRGAGYVTGVEVEMVSEDLDSGDQVSFHEIGVPGVQLFTGPHLDYHRPTDTVDRIDAAGLVKVASVAREAIEYLAGREGPLTSDLAGATAPAPGGSGGGERTVSLGTVPDFGWDGAGMRLSGVVPGSPAEHVGLAEGDVITALDDEPVGGLKDFSRALKTHAAGDRVTVRFSRNGEEKTAEAVLEAR